MLPELIRAGNGIFNVTCFALPCASHLNTLSMYAILSCKKMYSVHYFTRIVNSLECVDDDNDKDDSDNVHRLLRLITSGL